VRAPPKDDVTSVERPCEQAGELLGRILEVTVHHRNPRAARVVKTCSNRSMLPKVATQENTPHGIVEIGEAFDLRPRAIFGAVVDQDDLITRVLLAQGSGKSLVQVPYARLTAVHGHNDTEHRVGASRVALHALIAPGRATCPNQLIASRHRASIPPVHSRA
jgi:hypothetical protein